MILPNMSAVNDLLFLLLLLVLIVVEYALDFTENGFAVLPRTKSSELRRRICS